MPSTASVNRFIRRIAIPALLAAYGLFLVFDYRVQTDGGRQAIVEGHLANLRQAGDVDALIVGGSNAVFSLSASMLEEWTGTRWYNAALLNEGFSDTAYWDFVRRLAGTIDPAAVRTVVYSSLNPYRRGEIADRRAYHGPVSGQVEFSLKPARSVVNYLKDWLEDGVLTPTKTYPPPVATGDFQFARFECTGLPALHQTYNREDLEVAVNSAYRNLRFYAGQFPNARIVLALPSEFHDDDAAVGALNDFNAALFDALVARMADAGDRMAGRVSLISQPPFPDPALICDSPHHGNDAGRRFRTGDLHAQLAAQRRADRQGAMRRRRP